MASILALKRPGIAIDFGTANIRVIRRDEGIVLEEPSLCCFSRRGGAIELVAAGAEAHAMMDRTPADLAIMRPLCRGVLQDIEAARAEFEAAGKRILGPTRIGAHGTPVFFVHPKDMGGVLTEIMERPAGALHD